MLQGDRVRVLPNAEVTKTGTGHWDESGLSIELHVDGKRGDDNNVGSWGSPIKTIQEALTRAQDSTRILIMEGVYEEGSLVLTDKSGIVLEGIGNVVVTGSKRYTGWQSSGLDFFLDTNFSWGLVNAPDLNLTEVGKGSEMLFFEDELLVQVENEAEAVPGSYWVDRTIGAGQSRFWLRPKGNDDPNMNEVRISERTGLLALIRVANVTLRNLVFQHCASGSQHQTGTFAAGYTVAVFGEPDDGTLTNNPPSRTFSSTVRIEGCTFKWNNGSGITVANSKAVDINNCRFEDNGVVGLSMNRCQNVTISDVVSQRNNWRYGLLGGEATWAPAGAKLLLCDAVTVRESKFSFNYASGLWFDSKNENVVVEDCVIEHNRSNGFYWEKSLNCVLRRCRVEGNGVEYIGTDYWCNGVFCSQSKSLLIEDCEILDNHYQSISIMATSLPIDGYFSGVNDVGDCGNVSVLNCTILGGFDEKPLPEVPDYQDSGRTTGMIGMHVNTDVASGNFYQSSFLPGYIGNFNEFKSINPGNRTNLFSNGGNLGWSRDTFYGWKTNRVPGQDVNSSFELLAQ